MVTGYQRKYTKVSQTQNSNSQKLYLNKLDYVYLEVKCISIIQGKEYNCTRGQVISPVNKPVWASTGSMLAHYGMFMGFSVSYQV